VQRLLSAHYFKTLAILLLLVVKNVLAPLKSQRQSPLNKKALSAFKNSPAAKLPVLKDNKLGCTCASRN
jgi:hypothetical protein